MNEEIKEILEYFENNVQSNSIYMLKLDTNDAKLLLDYITNLQEENERLREIIKDYEQPLIFLKNRINQGMSEKVQNESAIRYVKGRLNILRGDK